MILNLCDYPAWRVSLNGRTDPERRHRDDGLMAIPVPAGPFTLDIRYVHLPDQMVGNAVSLLGLALLVVAMRTRSAA